MTTPWQISHDLMRTKETERGRGARDASHLAEWRLRRLPRARRGIAALDALVRRILSIVDRRATGTLVRPADQ